MEKELTLEKVIEHHLTQNMGQKITPHLVAGIALLLGQNIRKMAVPGAPSVSTPVENQHHG